MIKRKINDNNQIKKFTNRFAWNKRLYLTIPFIILMLLFVIIPLIFIFIYSFKTNSDTNNIHDNWGILTGTIGIKIGKSLYISIVSTIICLLISFPFAYFLAFSKNKIWKIAITVLVTAPIWINTLIKLIGLKTIFDIIGNEINATYGDIFTIIGLVYLYMPFMLIPLYNSLSIFPRNLINASKDLGRGNIYTFFVVVVPWTKQSLISAIILVLLPTFTTVAVPNFLNNNPDSGMIGDIIVGEGESGLSDPVALSRTSVLALIVSSIMLAIYLLIVYIPSIIKLIKKGINKNGK